MAYPRDRAIDTHKDSNSFPNPYKKKDKLKPEFVGKPADEIAEIMGKRNEVASKIWGIEGGKPLDDEKMDQAINIS